jgi:hypothetical protein
MGNKSSLTNYACGPEEPIHKEAVLRSGVERYGRDIFFSAL